MRWIIATFFFWAGVMHLRASDTIMTIMPSWVPFPRQTIFVTGLLEFVMVAALLTRPFRIYAGIAMALYAFCVWPVNIKHAVDGIDIPGLSSSWWYHGPRLVFQPVIMWWALWSAGVIDWPFRGKSA